MRGPKIEVYRESGLPGEYRWRFRAKNGRIIAQSSEGYRHIRDVVRSIDLTWPGARWGTEDGEWELRMPYANIPITVPEGVSLASRRRP